MMERRRAKATKRRPAVGINRGDLMRQIASLLAQIDVHKRDGRPVAKIAELEREIARLKRQLMAL